LDFKVAKWAKYKLLNLRPIHLIVTLSAFVFEFGMILAETGLLGHRKKIDKFLIGLPLSAQPSSSVWPLPSANFSAKLVTTK
jgi:hypothetical protein